MNDRRHALSLAAVLAATVLTGSAAILGVNHGSLVTTQPAPATAVVAQASAHPSWEEGHR